MRAKKSIYSNFFLLPFLHGVGGFLLFLSILILTKLLAYWLGTQNSFRIETEDAVLSSVGFILLSLIRLLDNFKSKESNHLKS